MFRSLLVILGVMFLAGWPSLSMPYRGDEALFTVVAQSLSEGDVLYRDHWDVTNPGIFWFYQLGGTLFGFHEEGVRLLEWFWMTILVIAVSEASRRQQRSSRLPLAPALFLGVGYYLAGYSYTSTLTKTEGLIGLPLFLGVWLASWGINQGRHQFVVLVLAGVCGGLVLLFKLLLGGCLAVAWLFLGLQFRRKPSRSWANLLKFAASISLGLFLVLGPVAAYFVKNQSLEILVETLFRMPPKFLAEGQPADLDRLAVSVKWFLGQYAFVLAFAVLGAGALLRKNRDPLTIALVLALVASFAAILAQRLSWWPYHFLLPGTLAGILAGYGWPAVVESVNELLNRPLIFRERACIAIAACMLVLEPLGPELYQFVRLGRYGMGGTAELRKQFRESIGTAYQEARLETNWLNGPDAKAGAIYVCGDPLFYFLSGRKPAARVSGWSLEIYPREVREWVAVEVHRSNPLYIFVSSHPHGYDRLIRDRYPELSQVLATEYHPIRTSKFGVWYASNKD